MSLSSFSSPALAWLRGVPDSYPRCLRGNNLPIDVSLARAQHRAYADALAEAGVALSWLPADELCPDSVFIEDTAVLLGPRALATAPGAAARAPEVPPVAEALARHVPLSRMAPPAALDGGDVLRAGDTLFVGLSGRTNERGVSALASVAAREGLAVRPVPLAAGLHLKSVVTLLDPGTLVLLDGALDPAPFLGAGLDLLLVGEPAGANVLALADRVLVSADAPETARRLSARGHAVVRLSLSELHKGDGALTCLSLRSPPPGRWCA